MTRSADGTVEVGRRSDGRWTWTWHDGDDAAPLVANESFDSADEAAQAAREAYPLALVRRPAQEQQVRRRRRLAGCLGPALALLLAWSVVRARRR